MPFTLSFKAHTIVTIQWYMTIACKKFDRVCVCIGIVLRKKKKKKYKWKKKLSHGQVTCNRLLRICL